MYQPSQPTWNCNQCDYLINCLREYSNNLRDKLSCSDQVHKHRVLLFININNSMTTIITMRL